MYRFWDLVIEPVIEAAGARRVVEIGALRGDMTVRMLERLGADVELHVIDPLPSFDPSEHEERFRGRYVFHRDTSHNVLPDLPPVDVALVDGDHNWYTVYHELRMLAETARVAARPLPVIVMHDVLWPYGRRDLYYDPQTIPEEFRQPYEQRGMAPGATELLQRGGLNPTLHNAVREGGLRNGVMTALEDFLGECDQPMRTVIVPFHFGLAIVVDQERLAEQEQLVAVLDELESAGGRYRQLELAESVALDDLLFQHNVYFRSERRLEESARRYLGLLKGALLDEHYLENEVRIEYLRRCANRQETPEPTKLHDPSRFMPVLFDQFAVARKAGSRSNDALPGYSLATMGRDRLEHLQRCLDVVRQENVAGDLVECGTGRGGGAIFMRGYLSAHGVADKDVWLADEFRGLAGPRESHDTDADQPPLSERSDLNLVREAFARFELFDNRVRFLQGELSATLPGAPLEKVALLRVDTGSYASTRVTLDALYDKVSVGGFVVVDDYRLPETMRAVDEFRVERGIDEGLEQIDFSGACWRKLYDRSRTRAVPATTGRRAPIAPRRRQRSVALSVVVVFYNMRREAERTLRSLTRGYQEGIEDLDYEVIVVENGSSPEQKLGDEFVRSFGTEFRYVDLAEDATPSPAPALNRGIAQSNGQTVAVMIDGAHVLTPGVLRFAMLGQRSHEPAVTAVQQWYVGPGQQPDVVQKGYDVEYEDRLFESIEWPTDGYRLFEIGHFVGERDWFDYFSESNCLFVPRQLLEQVGGFDESFSNPGGGFANLDFFERVAASPDTTIVTILGEGSFHQVHGGTTTNDPDADGRNRRLAEYAGEYADLRGRVLRGPNGPIHFVGTMFGDACRTRARRFTSPELWKKGQHIAIDGRPEKPVPMPDELTTGFVDAFWSSLAWQETTWLGHAVQKCPTDLLAYQEIIARVRPDWIVATGAENGGFAFFLASICDLVGNGRVLCIAEDVPESPHHPRISHLALDPLADGTVDRVREMVGENASVLLILGLMRKRPALKVFRTYAPLVPVGSYVVFEDTVTNGNPVWPGMGPGPTEAIQELAKTRLEGNVDFVADRELERFGLTFNPGGFLRRVQ